MSTHIAKTPQGASLSFIHIGYPKLDIQTWIDVCERATTIPEPKRIKALQILNGMLSWTSLTLDYSICASLLLAHQGVKQSSPELAVDGAAATRDHGLAEQFHSKDRVWLNKLAKDHLNLGTETPAPFDARMAHALSLSKGMRMEDASPGNFMGSQQAFALYCPDSQGYVDSHGNGYLRNAPICRAKLFESSAAARQFASRRKLTQLVSVVEVHVRATRALSFAENSNHDALLAAIARAESLELAELMRTREVEELRAQLARLESERAGQPPAKDLEIKRPRL